MEALTFFNKNLRAGDKIRLTMKRIDRTFVGFFGGYQMYEGIQPDLNYGIYPVFYRIGKNGRMLRRSIFGDGYFTSVCIYDIEDVEKASEPYRHVGYFNNFRDCHNLGIRGHEACLKAWKAGEGSFIVPGNNGVFDDIIADKETRILENGKYAVRIRGMDPADITEDDIAADGDCPCYIDIFERIDEEEA